MTMILLAHRTRRRDLAPPRHGFTLMEVLLVLTVMALVAAFSWPSIKASVKRNRLKRSADQIRGEWGSARLEAMASGKIMAFYYELGGAQFRIDRLYYDPDLEQTTDLPPLTESAGRELRGRIVMGALPLGVLFYAEAPAFEDVRVEPALDSNRVNVADGVWAPPVLFYPDGSTTDAYLTLISEDDDSVGIVMSLRGVTGAARVTPPTELSDLRL